VRTSLAVILRLTLAIACILSTGCSVCELARRTTIIEPSIFFSKKDKRRSLAVYSGWADAVWREESLSCPEFAARPDYSLGFHDGFVDYVYAGGTGEPPPIPPRHLWNVDFRSEEGHQRTEDWYAGYRHGAQVARVGGYRDLATIRTSVLGPEPLNNPIYGEDWQTDVYDQPQDEPLPTPATEPVMPPDMLEGAGNVEPPAEQPAQKPESSEPQSRPVVPPAPRNLPSTAPRIPRPSGDNAPPLDINALDHLPAEVPAESPAATRESTNEGAPTPPTVPLDEAIKLDSPATPAPTTSKPRSTELRFVGREIVSNRPPRALPVMSPPPTPIRTRTEPIEARPAAPSLSVIRLTSAASSTKAGSGATKSQGSTIQFRTSDSCPPDPTSPELLRIEIPDTH
jgi:hypothetical protein